LAANLHVPRHVGAHDEWIFAAHLEVHARDALGARDRDLLAGRHRAGEGHTIDTFVLHDRRAHIAGAGHQVDHAGGEIGEAVRQHERRQGRDLRRLGHHGVAGGQRRSELPGQKQ
jgi:hypothetical protein